MIREATGGSRLGRAGMAQVFADQVGTTGSTVSRWRDGVIPGPQWRATLAEALGVTEDDIDEASGPTVTLEEVSAKLDHIIELLERRRR